ncbi:hypothetical protein MJO28_006873 [Puccinia striiformis f. sp. tritici]|uniref:Uncharacterized protein n=1 Tax=Puccinia striiformis f. sp. tritici TaxID=168172 RepID=A0ACC0ECT8_9BASI|nr:hypothetical protein MJO28_006873 [Puccinia striiformis f. sp. tritici]KAI9622033.1 hypothetical protein H4Q26_015471 [Puccinia striiformis f. sp. tritici PST-130]
MFKFLGQLAFISYVQSIPSYYSNSDNAAEFGCQSNDTPLLTGHTTMDVKGRPVNRFVIQATSCRQTN